MDNNQKTSANTFGSLQGCQHIFSKGKNKGNHCGCVVKKDNLCSKHKKIAVDNNLQKYGNYGNPDQAELWLKWINSV